MAAHTIEKIVTPEEAKKFDEENELACIAETEALIATGKLPAPLVDLWRKDHPDPNIKPTPAKPSKDDKGDK